MTANQLSFMANQEQRRANMAREYETNRSNVANETETRRSNLAKEAENLRSHQASEQINMYDVVNKYLMQNKQLKETRRHNLSYEDIQKSSLSETRRHNAQSERKDAESNRIQEEHYKNNDFIFAGNAAGNMLGSIAKLLKVVL